MYLRGLFRLFFSNKKTGFTLVEAMISTTIFLFLIALVTNLLLVFSNNSNAQNIREEMSMDLRRSVERLEVELNSARNILKTFTLFAGTADSFTVTSRADQLVFSVPAYDDQNNPLFLSTGELLSDVVAIRVVENPEVKIERVNPVSKAVELLPLKKIEFSLDPAQGSRRQKIVKQSILQYYLPLSSSGEYQQPADGSSLSLEDGSTPKLFSFYANRKYIPSGCTYAKDFNKEIVEINPDCRQIIFTQSVKIFLLVEKNLGKQFFVSKRETEIILRNAIKH